MSVGSTHYTGTQFRGYAFMIVTPRLFELTPDSVDGIACMLRTGGYKQSTNIGT